jgi:sigma-B regulation protein RsbU (phosphoserine phosphatase)
MPTGARRAAGSLSKATLVLAGLYFLGGRIGLAVPFTSGNVSPVWPPAGIALAGILLFGYRVWPAVAIGAFLVNFLSPIPHYAAIGIAAGNTAGPLVGAWLLQRIPGFRPSLTRLRDVIALIVFGGFCGTAVSATVGTLALFLADVNAWSSGGSAWLIWWLGDAMGVLIVAPLVLTIPCLRAIRGARRLLELAVLLLGTVACCALVFGTRPGLGSGRDILALTFPLLMVWGALRFEAVGAAIITFVVAAAAVWATAHGLGPFVVSTSLRNATLLQSFLTVIAVSGLTVAALIAERTRLIRQQAEREAARQGEDRYREISETANEGVWILDSQLVTCFVNRRMAQMLGYSVAEMLGKPVLGFVFAEDAEREKADLDRRKHGVSEQLETRYRRKDGSELWARVSTTGSFDAEGQFTGALAMVSDITEQKRHEAEGRRSRHQILLLSRAVEQTADSVLVTDRRGIIEYVNPAFEATTGYEWKEAVGRTPAILKSGHHDREFYRGLWDELSHGRPFRGTLVNRKKGGELYWAEQTITPIRDDEGDVTHFVSVLKDVTELRRKQEQEVQLRLAREVQQQFYRAPIVVPGLDLAAASYPAQETGGDYFDVIPASAGSAYVAIGDASGHGLGSALVMALTRAYLRSFAAMNLDVGDILTRVNGMLASDLEDNRFVTLLLTRIDAPNHRLSYANAGHVSGVVVRGGNGVPSILASTGLPLGMFAESEFPSGELPLQPRDVVLLVTDGVTESVAEGEDQLAAERLIAYGRAHGDRSARQIADGICEAARSFAGAKPQADDITSVVVKVQSSCA